MHEIREDPDDVTEAQPDRRRWLLVALALVAVLSAVDLIGDLRGGTGLAHVLGEATITIVVLVAAALEVRLQARRMRESAATSAALVTRLRETEIEAARFRRDASELVHGLAQAIDAQLEHWGLSAAEKETALLLLKGLSHREIGEARQVGEATARQQARAIYKKAGLAGRHDLAAFFLEDLLAPG